MEMDWTTVMTALISALSGGGIVGVFYFRENKRKKELENDALASDGWQELYAKSEERNDRMSQKIDQLYSELSKFRDDNNRLTTENAVLTMQKCEKKGCGDRIPPRGW